MTKLLILDKDGTLVKPKSGSQFVQHPEDQDLIPCVAEAIARYSAEGWLMAIASNQGGVAAGHKTLDEAIAEMHYAMHLTGIEYGYFCPDFEGLECWYVGSEGRFHSIHENLNAQHLIGTFRKPNPGMINHFRYWAYVSPESTLMIGDRPEDEGAAKAAGVAFMWANEWRGDRPDDDLH